MLIGVEKIFGVLRCLCNIIWELIVFSFGFLTLEQVLDSIVIQFLIMQKQALQREIVNKNNTNWAFPHTIEDLHIHDFRI